MTQPDTGLPDDLLPPGRHPMCDNRGNLHYPETRSDVRFLIAEWDAWFVDDHNPPPLPPDPEPEPGGLILLNANPTSAGAPLPGAQLLARVVDRMTLPMFLTLVGLISVFARGRYPIAAGLTLLAVGLVLLSIATRHPDQPLTLRQLTHWVSGIASFLIGGGSLQYGLRTWWQRQNEQVGR